MLSKYVEYLEKVSKPLNEMILCISH